MSEASHAQDVRRALAWRLIRADVEGLLDLNHGFAARDKPVLALLFAPMASLFLIEVRKYIEQRAPSALPAMSPQLERSAQESRASLKQADHVGEYVGRLSQVLALHEREFRSKTGGLLGPLRRALARDMGVCRLGPHVILTSYHAALALGGGALGPVSSPLLGRQAHALARQAGEYIGAVGRGLHMNLDRPPRVRAPGPFPWRDVRSKVYLGALAHRLGSSSHAFAAAVLGAVTAVNVATFVVPRMQCTSEPFVFKVRFLLLFHALWTLKRLKAFGSSKGFLSRSALGRLAGSRETSRGTSDILARRKLRKLLVHYAERSADTQDVIRGELVVQARQLADGGVPADLSALVDTTASNSAQELSSFLTLA
jgi:hypothetical protein